jgi:hypothetical protein
MLFNVTGQTRRTVGDPNEKYTAMQESWRRARAIMGGEATAKAADLILDTTTFSNLLLPFSTNMTQAQYDFYKAEAELPGLTGQYASALIGGLLRKQPQFTLPKSLDNEENRTWLNNSFGAQGQSLVSFLADALAEEMQTSRAWVLVETSAGVNAAEVKPFAVNLPAESVINWRRDENQRLIKLTLRYYTEEFEEDNPHHPTYVDTVSDYNIVNNQLVVTKYKRKRKQNTAPTREGNVVVSPPMEASAEEWEQFATLVPLLRGEPMTFIPAWPLNGSIEVQKPMNQTLVDREISLYNKVSRRNHLLYGACTYTPVISGNFPDDDSFQRMVVNKGLGSWLNIPEGASATILQTPTAAIKDINESIEQNVAEMSRMGIRMLTPDGTAAESGVALEIKNASQTSQLGLLNNKASKSLEIIISMMLHMRYDIAFSDAQEETSFTLSVDFNPTPLGADWMRLVTEWYEGRKIPRSVFLQIAKQNDILPMDYDDKVGQQEIEQDPLIMDAMPSAKVDVENALRKAQQ